MCHRVREGTRDDIQGIMQVLDASLLRADYEEVVELVETELCFVAENEDRKINSCIIAKDRGDEVFITHLATLPPKRRRGLATRLINRLIEVTVSDKRIVAETTEKSRGFYSSLGFKIKEGKATRRISSS
ncbi:MAG: GNAT family N-acetyltransferase [Halobacteria archaeon]|nr:GNAT family N-acetyltransferase [Halobacteria archaeon]